MGRNATWNRIRTYPVEIALILDSDVWARTLKQMQVPVTPYPDSAAATTFFRVDGIGTTRRAIVTMNPTKELVGIQIAAMLAHEAQHVVQFIEQEIGEDKFSCEAECYLLQHIFQDLMQDYVQMLEQQEKNN